MIEPVAIECAFCQSRPFWQALDEWADAVIHAAESGHNQWVLRLSNGTTVPIGPWVPQPGTMTDGTTRKVE